LARLVELLAGQWTLIGGQRAQALAQARESALLPQVSALPLGQLSLVLAVRERACRLSLKRMQLFDHCHSLVSS